MTVNRPLFRAREVRARFTADEFMELVEHAPINDWTGKVELVDGEVVRMAPANIPHWSIQQNLSSQLRSIFAELGPDWLVGPEPSVRLGPSLVREPDVAVFQRPDLTAKVFDRAALFLAIEVADTSLRIDLGRKLADYAQAGVPHYWVADIAARQIWVMSVPQGRDYANKERLAFGEPLPVPGTDQTITLD